MRVVIRNKWISLGGSSYVNDENENPLLKVKGKIFTFTNKKIIQELDGTPIYIVRNKFWYLFHRQSFVIDMEGNKVAHLSRKIFSFHDHYNITSTKYGNVILRGNILGFDYHITVNDQEVGHVSRKISLRDSFVLDIDDNYDWKYFTALVIALDVMVDKMRSDSNSYNY